MRQILYWSKPAPMESSEREFGVTHKKQLSEFSDQSNTFLLSIGDALSIDCTVVITLHKV